MQADLRILWSKCSFLESVTKHSKNGIKMGDHARFIATHEVVTDMRY